MPIELPLPYQSPMEREALDTPKATLYLTPYNVQRIIKEIVTTHWLNDDPALSGYGFNQRYKANAINLTANDSNVFIGMELEWAPNPLNMRPSIIVARGDASYTSPVIGQRTKINPINSEETKLHISSMRCNIACIASPVGLAEQIAEWTAKPLLQFEHQIKNDFKFRWFRMAAITKPQEYKECKDYYIVIIPIDVTFDSNTLIIGDHLKLKTISKTVFLNLTNYSPLLNQ
jgi:hypothetical protein